MIYRTIYNIIPPLNNKPPLIEKKDLEGNCMRTINLDGGTITPLIKRKRCLVRSTPLIINPP